ncbi:AMP-binding enzyme [Streptomyces sp. NPDC055078]
MPQGCPRGVRVRYEAVVRVDLQGQQASFVPDHGERLASPAGPGSGVSAVVELRPGRSVTAEWLIALCRESLGGVRTPKEVVFVGRLPRSVSGKVLKKNVRARFWPAGGRAI